MLEIARPKARTEVVPRIVRDQYLVPGGDRFRGRSCESGFIGVVTCVDTVLGGNILMSSIPPKLAVTNAISFILSFTVLGAYPSTVRGKGRSPASLNRAGDEHAAGSSTSARKPPPGAMRSRRNRLDCSGSVFTLTRSARSAPPDDVAPCRDR
jgi:hypothetical protein